MDWWKVIFDKINTRDKLFTPGRGPEGARKKPFTILSKDLDSISILSGRSGIRLEKECFEIVQRTFSDNPSIWLRIAAIRETEPLPNSVDELVRVVSGSQLARGNYISSILEYCGLVRYSMHGSKKGVELPRR